MVVLDANDLFSASKKIMLPSLTFSLKMRAKLLPRDTGATSVQNLPTIHNGAKTGPTVTINTPAADDVIDADSPNGVQTNLRTIDDVVHAKLEGGYTRDSDVNPTESVDNDAAYDIICVPMWSGYGHEGIISSFYAPDVPNPAGSAPYAQLQQDEAFIPLPWPMTIHHVTAVVNYQSPTAGTLAAVGGLHPTSPTLTNEVTVSIGVGRRADEYTFQDVATASWIPTTKAAITIDRVLGVRGSEATAETPGGAKHWDFELLQLPLVTGPLGAGQGYYTQGKPFFVGQASSKMWARTAVGNGNAGDGNLPYTRGTERFIHVAWSFQDTGGLSDVTATPAGAAGDPSEVYVGYMGHWVQIVGKKHLATIDNEIPTGS